MGCGAWTAQDWNSYSTSKVAGRSTSAIYTAAGMKPEFNPKDVIRESRDSVDHPASTPIIIGLDVTGSMNHLLNQVAQKLGDLVGEILDRKPVADPQILFAAVGDHVCDSAPLQVTQFESDIRIAEQLTQLWFERGGGGNRFESYPLVWYFAANHTSTDQFEKRGKKGFLFTIGDDGYPPYLPASVIQDIFGDNVPEDFSITELLTQVNRQYEVFHLCMRQGGTYRDDDLDSWQQILGERAIPVADYTKIPEIIVSLLEAMAGKSVADVVASWDGTTAIAVNDALKGLSHVHSSTEVVEF
jgi:hypothetical protein